MSLSLRAKKELTLTAIRIWIDGTHANDKACCVKLVNDEIFDQLVEQVKQEKEAAKRQPFLFNEE